MAAIFATLTIVYPGAALGAEPTVDVVALEFRFEPTNIVVDPGPVTFVVRNGGVIEHNFIIETPSGEAIARIPNIEVGRTEQVSVSLEPGSYATVCTLPGHREAGMVGTLTVAAPGDVEAGIVPSNGVKI